MAAAGHVAARGGLQFKARMKVVTIGGWKRREGERVSRTELSDVVCRSLGLDNDHYVRDAFNMVELNTVIMECERHKLHVPPWLRVDALDPPDTARPGVGRVRDSRLRQPHRPQPSVLRRRR